LLQLFSKASKSSVTLPGVLEIGQSFECRAFGHGEEPVGWETEVPDGATGENTLLEFKTDVVGANSGELVDTTHDIAEVVGAEVVEGNNTVSPDAGASKELSTFLEVIVLLMLCCGVEIFESGTTGGEVVEESGTLQERAVTKGDSG